MVYSSSVPKDWVRWDGGLAMVEAASLVAAGAIASHAAQVHRHLRPRSECARSSFGSNQLMVKVG